MPALSLTEWQEYKSRRDAEGHKPVENPRRIWEWQAEHGRGIEGLDTARDQNQIMWYQHSHSPHGYGGTHMQTYKEFLETGPHIKISDQVLDELYDAIIALTQ